MGDLLGPSADIRVMRLEQERKKIELNVLGCQIRLQELEEERQRLHENLEASEPKLAEIDEQIEAMKKEKSRGGQ